MAYLIKFAIFVFSVLLSTSYARNGCRLCSGTYSLYFDNGIDAAAARANLESKLGTCATGKQFLIKSATPLLCQGINCKKWVFDMDIYRFCGNGKAALRARDKRCSRPNQCFYADDLNLHCTQSVGCAETCHCNECGC